jgi:tetratricopeptide (TPR) repeat protein
LGIIAAGLLGIHLAHSAVGDELVLVPGAKLKQAKSGRVLGQVKSESAGEVVVSVGTSTVSVPTDQILSIRYDGQPATLQLAETRENAGQLAEAAELFKKAAGEAADKPLVAQMALYREASALTGLALAEPDRVKDALDRLLRFVQAYPSGRHIIAALEDLVRLQLKSGDYKGAEAATAELAKFPQGSFRASVLHAKMLAQQGHDDAAIAELDRIITSLPDRSTVLRDATLVKVQDLVGLKKYKEAETLVRKVIQDTPAEDAVAQSALYNTLGDCLRAANRPKDALLAYLHTDLLYSKDRQEHSRALFQIEKLFRQLKQESRADEFAQRLRQEYPRSQWASASAPK